MAISAKALAEILEISPASVSMVLNGRPGISEETRGRVLAAAELYGCKTRQKGKKASQGGCLQLVIYKNHGSVVGDTPFFSEISEGVSRQIQKHGYNLQVSYFYKSQNEQEQLASIKSSGSDGIILLATEMSEQDLAPFSAIGLPLLLMDNSHDSQYDCVVINNARGAYDAVKYLMSMGHTDIGYLSSNVAINNFRERQEGYKKAVLSSPGTARCENQIIKVAPTIDGAYLNMSDFLAAHPKLPTAFFADNDIIATSCMRAMKDAGYRLPEDVSVIGFDDTPMCELFRPSLSTMHVPKQSMGVLAVNRLLSVVNGETDCAVKIAVSTTLVERGSVKKLF